MGRGIGSAVCGKPVARSMICCLFLANSLARNKNVVTGTALSNSPNNCFLVALGALFTFSDSTSAELYVVIDN